MVRRACLPPGRALRGGSVVDRSFRKHRPGCSLSVEHREIRLPRPHGNAILLRHHTSDLRYVSQIVDHPRRQQLPQLNRSKVGMLTHQVELPRAELHGPEFGKVRLAQHLEASEQLRQRATLSHLEVARSVERFETSIL